MRPTYGTALCLALALTVSCAAPSAAPTSAAPPTAVAPASATPSPTPTVALTATAATSPILRFELTDVRTGQRFTLGGFAGKTVLVLGMAVW